MKKFGIKSIVSVKFIDKNTGEELKDIRDVQSEYKEYDENADIVELLINTTIPLEWMHDEFFNQFGHDESQPLYDKWVWEREKIKNATKEDLWQAYGLISGYWLNEYMYWFKKEQYEFRQYRREKGEDLSVLKYPI